VRAINTCVPNQSIKIKYIYIYISLWLIFILILISPLGYNTINKETNRRKKEKNLYIINNTKNNKNVIEVGEFFQCSRMTL